MTRRAVPAFALLMCAWAMTGCSKKVAVKTPQRTQPVESARSTPAPAPEPFRRSEPAVAPSVPSRSSMPDAATRRRIDELLSRIQDAYFDYDKHTLRPDAEQALRTDAQTLSDIIRQYPDFKLVVQGHCDERGSDEYNLALGDARANKAKEYLVTLGLPGAQMNTISYGKQKPVCTEADEACWQKNRRAHLTTADGSGGQ
jgi:peptidoglycan-associated lipoprotein